MNKEIHCEEKKPLFNSIDLETAEINNAKARITFALILRFIILINHVYGEIYFQEQFKDGDGWKERWILSEHQNDYGKFNLSYGQFYNDPVEDLGLTTTEDFKHYAISAKFPKFSNKDKPLIIQYATKRFTLPEEDCGGLYIKIMKSEIDQKDFNGDTPYHVMFGPDICGVYVRKIHAIFRYNNSYYSCNSFLPIFDDELYHVYTLILYPNNSIEILADNEQRISGELEDHYDFLKPRKIFDPSVEKPADWVDDEFIPDPDDKKPDDWDQPEFILDLDVKRPDDWDDEWDGEWEPPGKVNPDYKGEWSPREIKNPAYKGEWIHPKIDNPDYVPDPNLYLFDDIGTIGIDLWQTNSGTTFDNIIITDSIEEAQEFAALTLNVSRIGEDKMRNEFYDKLEREEEMRKKEEKEKLKKEEGKNEINSNEEEEKTEELEEKEKEEEKKKEEENKDKSYDFQEEKKKDKSNDEMEKQSKKDKKEMKSIEIMERKKLDNNVDEENEKEVTKKEEL
uniref:Calreticulin n=1 Tax=Setaria digitata TaxID=48799 RepID=A0A915PUF6_9BILA